jgi:hypothetical protein
MLLPFRKDATSPTRWGSTYQSSINSQLKSVRGWRAYNPAFSSTTDTCGFARPKVAGAGTDRPAARLHDKALQPSSAPSSS